MFGPQTRLFGSVFASLLGWGGAVGPGFSGFRTESHGRRRSPRPKGRKASTAARNANTSGYQLHGVTGNEFVSYNEWDRLLPLRQRIRRQRRNRGTILNLAA